MFCGWSTPRLDVGFDCVVLDEIQFFCVQEGAKTRKKVCENFVIFMQLLMATVILLVDVGNEAVNTYHCSPEVVMTKNNEGMEVRVSIAYA